MLGGKRKPNVASPGTAALALPVVPLLLFGRMSSTLFESYPASLAARDEWRSEHPGLKAVYDQIEAVLHGMSPADIERLSRLAQDLMRDQGITFHVYHDQQGTERILPFDLMPLPVAPEEWNAIEIGLSQRVKAWNAFLSDIYSNQEILKANIIPYEVVYADPEFHRECVGIKVVQNTYVHVAATDLIRDAKGRWLALEDHLSNPTGASYALQNRRVLSQICPQLMEGLPLMPIYDYPTQLLETLQAVAPTGPAAARVVLLSPGIYNEAYYDHSSLARQMGIPLVQGGDLIVLDSHLYLKTIGGLERVDVVYRRLDSAFIDPVTFRADSHLGVPGLLSCLRKGTVTIANALGSGLGDNRDLAAYVPKMIEFYLNETPRLPSVQTFSCRDVDVREEVFDHLDRYVIKSSTLRGLSGAWVGSELDSAAKTALIEEIRKNPGHFVAQPEIEFSTAPTWINSTLQPRHVGIRAFVLCQGEKITVTPCALTRVALTEGSLVISSGAGGGSKDTWILRTARNAGSSPETIVRHQPRRMRLGSRTADSLFWIGRYAERAESTVRILRVIQQIRLEDNTHQNPKAWHPLWEALATATGHPTSFFKKASFQKATSLSEYILLEEENYASAVSCLKSCRQNAQLIREALPPEVWTNLNRLYLQLAVAAQEKTTPKIRADLQSLSLHDDLLGELDELACCVEKHMLHNDAWYFWQLGRHLERALFSVFTMKQVFLKRQDERLAGGLPTEDTNLDALLRMLAGQYAYRSSYKSRPVASQVAHLLLQDEEFPRSLAFCLAAIQHALQRTFGERPAPEAAAPMRYAGHFLSELGFADIGKYFDTASDGAPAGGKSRTKAFADWMDHLVQRLLTLGTLISDHYLNHQAAEPVRPSALPSNRP
jgi:uncharacterized circularly permuted ATP-grasp superfamily protein/uncharacterized alpha-E superfamily protein